MAEDSGARLAALASEASACVRCELASSRTLVVFGEGNPESPLMIVGEGPGEREDLTGRPFVGRAGALLDECLAENRITRKHVYIANVVKCRACTSENGRKRNRPPTAAEANACRPWLTSQIEIIAPRVVLCLGSPSANALIHTNFKIMQERGKFFEVAFADYAIAALHPAYVLRQSGQAFRDLRATLVADIAAARLKVIEVRRQTPKTENTSLF